MNFKGQVKNHYVGNQRPNDYFQLLKKHPLNAALGKQGLTSELLERLNRHQTF